MPFAAALSTAPETSQAVAEVCSQSRAQLTDRPDLAVLFFSAHHTRAASAIVRTVRSELEPSCLFGCVAETVIGNDQEVEQAPALGLWLAHWNHPVAQQPFHLVLERTADGPSMLGWPDALSDAQPADSAVLLLGDPYTFPIDLLLSRINDERPGLRVLGGMASGIHEAGECRLLLDDQVLDQGAVGVLLQGPTGLRSVVSQGCRPIGRHMVITRASENVILELSGKPPLVQLRELWQTLRPEEQQLLQHGLHIGRVLNEYRGEFQRGDFLVRNVLKVDRMSGILAITDRVRVGQTVQFHVRDAATADEDLRALLQLDLSAHEHRPAGALVFSCNGRGTRLFTQPHHDARAVREEVGPIALIGFFAQGELGPVSGQNCIHGFSASVALFEE